MGELMIRRNRTFAAPQYQGAAKAGKTSSAGQSQPAARSTGVTVSETLREMAGKAGQMESDIRAGRRLVQTGQGVLDEIRDSLNRLAELARRAAGEGDADREALQEELERLSGEIDRMIRGAAAGDTPLFLDGEGEITSAAQLLVRLLEQAEAGVSPDQAIRELTGGAIESLDQLKELLAGGGTAGLQETLIDLLASAGGASLLKLLAGMQGGNLDLMMSLLTNLQNTQTAPESAAGPGPAGAREQPAPGNTLDLAGLQAEGKDLSGLSFDRASGVLTLSGAADVTLRGNGQEAGEIRLTGSGTVTLEHVRGSALRAEAPQVRVVLAGENALDSLLMEQKTVLTLEGGGRLELRAVRGDASNTLRLTDGQLLLRGEAGEGQGELTVPAVLEGTALLAARTADVSDAAGRKQEPMDLIWKTLLPGWDRLTALEVDGKRLPMDRLQGDAARLWLARGDQGFPAHRLVFQNREKEGRLRTRYAYLQWNRRREALEEVSMYPNPFAVTGGEAERDWLYEEETQTLYILSAQVTAVSGGAGVDANRLPFSGRIALADGIGAVELTLEGVMCQVISGRAFDLGEENDVTLVLPGGSSNLFTSGAGCAGITLGEGTVLCVDCVRPEEEDEAPAGTLTAAGGLGCAGIGRDGVAGWDPADPVRIRGGEEEEEHSFLGPVTIAGGTVLPPEEDGGIPLKVGEETVVLPQFQLSVRSLGLNGMSLMTRAYARDAEAVLQAAGRRVEQMQAVYGVIYDWLGRGSGSLPGSQFTAAREPVRSAGQAETLLEDTRRTILLEPSQAVRTHGRRGGEGAGELLR